MKSLLSPRANVRSSILNSRKAIVIQIILVATWITSCAPLISLHDPQAYQNAIDLKVDFRFLVESSAADASYAAHTDDITAFKKKLMKAYEYEKGRERNGITIQQYETLLKDDGPVYGFLRLWQEQGKTSESYRKSRVDLSDDIFDQIIKLERAKRTEGIKLKVTSLDSNQTQ